MIEKGQADTPAQAGVHYNRQKGKQHGKHHEG